ncbi:hypothetical protein I546_5447 [Mycobacterium kansasii 732]|nr:hypothetical protein I546_5447 [Mycobacterium kansasii 732]
MGAVSRSPDGHSLTLLDATMTLFLSDFGSDSEITWSPENRVHQEMADGDYADNRPARVLTTPATGW